jgi:hypothetical protein
LPTPETFADHAPFVAVPRESFIDVHLPSTTTDADFGAAVSYQLAHISTDGA